MGKRNPPENKDLELSFEHYFLARHQQYAPADIIIITKDAFKAVVGNKQNIDATQLKKVVELWEDVHTPVVTAYFANVFGENDFNNFQQELFFVVFKR